ncbi:MAG: poly-gamma-glutamate synthase PgsB [candidate division KSB1 bacterium]|nr:poly-gamma-glutamate synthase PgsB [candidate division KSB1 bacterium]MDZ7358497.1 poly-gamma-glutamate synthase PgsB [candidate division KSB1 bacterium]MDZ7401477.1 poly-gamma-glutamate synthase PgsB [candidate division KSB1 bacterium]
MTILCFMIYLIAERILLERRLQAIPLRITVTGTRGKTTLVRMIAAVLRASGKRVLAKTTGSEAKYILPDGSEQYVPRRGLPTILEQKHLLRKAVQLQVNCIVSEIMSIHPENHFIESQQLLRPNIVLITNIRLDHIDAMGETEDQIASVFCLDLPPNAKLFIPATELRPSISAICKKNGIHLIAISEKKREDELDAERYRLPALLSDHIALASALGHHLGMDDETISKGINSAQADIGGLKIWRYQSANSGPAHYLVNAFAANDPTSTREILDWVKKQLPEADQNLIGLLNLRADRGDRTLQWIHALKNGSEFNFKQIFVIGAHKKVMKRHIPSVQILSAKQPTALMTDIFAKLGIPSVIFGFGNIAGLGRLLVEHWNLIGEAYEI